MRIDSLERRGCGAGGNYFRLVFLAAAFFFAADFFAGLVLCALATGFLAVFFAGFFAAFFAVVLDGFRGFAFALRGFFSGL